MSRLPASLLLRSAPRGRLVHRARSALLLPAAVLTACDATQRRAERPELPSWHTGPEQIRIGSIDHPDHAYGVVRRLAVDEAGRIYTAHAQEAQVRRWTPEGEADGVVGREGEGPGEFSDVRRMGLFGDTLWAVDGRANRMSFFDLDGTFLGALAPPVDIGERDAPYPLPARPELPLRGGGFYGRSPAFSHAIAVGDLTWTPHVRMDAAGVTTDTVYRQPHRPEHQLALLSPDGVGGTFSSQPFPDGPILVADPALERLLVVDRAAWTGAGVAEFSITALSMSGDTLWRQVRSYQPIPLPSERLDSAASAQARSMHEFMSRFEAGLTESTLERRVRDVLYRPAFLPPVTNLVAGRDGTVWIELAAAPAEAEDEGRPWLVLDRDGTPIALAVTPRDLRVLEADREHVWGVVTDELDVSYIVRHAIVDTAPLSAGSARSRS